MFVYQVGGDTFGSGVLVKIGERIFVFSAAHVIEGDIDINLGIIPHQSRFSILTKWSDQETDIGFLELNPSEVQLRLSEVSAPYAVGMKKAQAIPSKQTTLALCGFPSGEASETNRGREIPATYITVAILAFEHWPDDLKTRYDPKKTFVIPYGDKWGGSFVDGNKRPREPISPFGISGCGLWYYDPTTENSEKPMYALVGIQHSYNRQLQVLIGTLMDPLIERVSQHYNLTIQTAPGGAPETLK